MKALAVLLGALPLIAQSGKTAQTGMKDAFAELQGVRLHYVDTGGSGEAVVFLHAATGSTESWAYQIPAVTGAGYRFIAFDRRGWGKTAVTTGANPGTAADDLLALVNQLGIEKFHLVATAAGGFVGLDFALSYPQRLRSLVISSSIGSIQDTDYQQMLKNIRPPEFEALPPDFRELGPSYRAAHADGVARWLELEKQSRSGGPRPTAQPSKNRATLAMLEQIHVPTLMIAGGADLFAPPPVMRKMADHIKGSEFLVLPLSGHSVSWEYPEEFNAAVLKFVRANQGK